MKYNDDLQIIPATLNDIPALLTFMERFYAIDKYDFHRGRAEKSLIEFIPDERLGRIWMILAEQKQIGYIILAYNFCFEFGGRNAFVDEFYIEEQFRRKGFGRRVMDDISTEAKRMDIKALHLEVEHHNISAVELYRSLQFKDHHRILMTRTLEN